ncbi:T9SS type A sorting domain-containing protein [Flavobacterium litorale]|uniref:T9SS type A sorting domain-containing protein n=1 Tax=Flavobacterium litorale TaxID=2856519 RepID=A0ABX8V4E5_9FLAO|nr:T9SS type A sorting domain-containing protein [Flavobacterium litorale]QYJ67710.1 T9SS type A sorting domain-containing protein [Flavobacterium litorale]
MKKHLLIGALTLGSFLTANAQADCANAIAIAADGTQTAGAITGTYGNSCFGGTMNSQNPQGALQANWYSYTPAANGLLTISSALDANPTASTDTRLSVFTGTCDALQCYNGADDVSGDDFRTTLTIPVEAGVVYYIAWDNNWLSTGFDFSVALEAADCLSPNTLAVNDFTGITASSAAFDWTAAIGTPANYDVKVGALGFDPVNDAATDFSTATNSLSLSGLSVDNNGTLDVYVRGNCGGSQGTWVGPYRLYLAATSNYTNGFDEAASGRLDGFTVESAWNVLTNAQVNGANPAHQGDGFVFTNALTTGPANAWMFSRALSLQANQEVTLSFFTSIASTNATAMMNLDITFGNAPTIDAQGVPVQSLQISGATFSEQTVSFTPTEDGIYYIGFHQNSPTAATAASLVLDTVSISGPTANVVDVDATEFAVYPNPATNVINVANANNSLLSAINIVDLNGRTVKSMKYDGATQAQINISDLASGVYIMNIASDRGTITKKIVKN